MSKELIQSGHPVHINDGEHILTLVMDKTGSMWPYRDAVIAEHNTMLARMRAELPLQLTWHIHIGLITFNTERRFLSHRRLPEFPKLNDKTYNPRRETALYDSVISAINKT